MPLARILWAHRLCYHVTHPLPDLTFVASLHKVDKQFIAFLGGKMFSSIFNAVKVAWHSVTSHHQLHALEHVGPFAGSLLHTADWDH